MNGSFFNKKRVLVAPLDWGLGHATRCIPVINRLLLSGCTVLVAAEGSIKSLLQREFPQLEFLPLKGYNISYSRKKWWLPVKMLLQMPNIFRSIRHENKWLKQTVAENKIDIVISDNRFGLYCSGAYCIYITHQQLIKTGNKHTEQRLQKLHYRYINRYNECWVPDNEKENILAGELSHSLRMPKIKTTYIGPLSRFEKREEEKIYDLLIMLSGPEPQRSLLEEKLLQQLKNYSGYVLMVRGKPGDASFITAPHEKIKIENHLPSTELNKAMNQSCLVICRSGYSSIMDLAALQQRAILIPTPGQTEQEYLAKWLMEKKMFYAVEQKDFLLEDALKESADFYL